MIRLATGLCTTLMLVGSAWGQRQAPPIPSPPPPPAGRMVGNIIIGPQVGPASHRPLQSEQELEDFRRWLMGKNKKNDPEKIDPELLKKLMEKLPKDKKVDQKQIEQMFEKNPELKDPAFLKQLEQLLNNKDFPQNLEDKFPKNQDPPKLENGAELGEKLKKIIDSGNQQTDPKKTGPDGELPKSDLDVAGGDKNELPKSPYADNEWVKWFEKNFKDSATSNDALKDLFSSLEKSNGKGIFDDIPELKNGNWKDIDSWGKENAGDLWKTKPPDMGGTKMTPPNFGNGSGGGSNWGGGGGSSGGGSGFGGGSGASFEGGSTVLMVMLGAAAAVFLAILFLRKWKHAEHERRLAGGAGSIPIDFDAIRSREELVRVFDKVSIERCGDAARNWNHRVIADQFTEAQPALGEPALSVAGLYERARYAPLDEDLTPPEFSDARRDLRSLAGVAS